MSHPRLLALGAVLLVGVGGYYLATPACACLTRDQAAHAFLHTEIHRILDAQQGYWAEHHRYAPTYEALGYVPDTLVQVELAAATDSTLRLEGISVRWPGVTCALEATPATTGLGALACSGHASR